MKRKIELLGGPYNGRVIEYGGECRLRMCLCESGKPVPGEWIGEAIYEPEGPDFQKAFWLDNTWLLFPAL